MIICSRCEKQAEFSFDMSINLCMSYLDRILSHCRISSSAPEAGDHAPTARMASLAVVGATFSQFPGSRDRQAVAVSNPAPVPEAATANDLDIPGFLDRHRVHDAILDAPLALQPQGDGESKRSDNEDRGNENFESKHLRNSGTLMAGVNSA